ncbi:MAG: acyl-CoA dehydrogenase family protein [Gemmatimonadetes bacterium]|nr:acyl-CoA dehydrogenase family protein [Gemmatimonadota bacterium]
MTTLLARYEAFVNEMLLPLEPLALAQPWTAIEAELNAARQAARDRGLWAPHLPAAYGGLAMPMAEFAEVSAILGRTPVGHYACNVQAPDVGNMELLLTHGSAEQQERFLRPLAAGTIRSCFGMTEPGRAGSNPVWLDTTAVRDGDGWVINGRKWFATSAEGASFCVVLAVTTPGAAKPHQRASMFIVPTDTPGYALARNIPVMGHVGAGYASHGELTFTDCRVPASAMIGAEGAGFLLAQERLGPGRVHHCMRWIGICDRAIDLMCRYALRRELAPGEPLAYKQAVRHWIAESRAETEAARLFVRDTVAKLERVGQREARDEISMIKYFVPAVMQKVLDRALQVHGGYGLTDATPLANWWAHERAARIYDGPDEVHKDAVAKHTLARCLPPRS